MRKTQPYIHLMFLVMPVLLVGLWAQDRPSGKEMRIMKKWKMIEYLNLDETQSERFFPRVNALENNLENIREQQTSLRNRLRNLKDEDHVDYQQINDLNDEIYDLEEEANRMIREHMRNVDDILSPEQKVKYTIFEDEFKKQIKTKVSERTQSGKRPFGKRK